MEIEDRQYLTVINEVAAELESILVRYNQQAHAISQDDKTGQLGLRLDQMVVLREFVERCERVLAFHAGMSVEPKQHFGEAVLLPSMGGGAG